MAHVRAKLGVRSRTQAIQLACGLPIDADVAPDDRGRRSH
jgi:hypothetical protein